MDTGTPSLRAVYLRPECVYNQHSDTSAKGKGLRIASIWAHLFAFVAFFNLLAMKFFSNKILTKIFSECEYVVYNCYDGVDLCRRSHRVNSLSMSR